MQNTLSDQDQTIRKCSTHCAHCRTGNEDVNRERHYTKRIEGMIRRGRLMDQARNQRHITSVTLRTVYAFREGFVNVEAKTMLCKSSIPRSLIYRASRTGYCPTDQSELFTPQQMEISTG